MENFGDKSSSSVIKPDLFISDLHLCPSRPHITAAFLNFLQNTVSQSNALYILGDLFEYWVGDDDIKNPHHQPIIKVFRTLAESGVNIFFMPGNRDFLISKIFCDASKITLLNDPSLVDLHGQRALLSHGDDLCTDDIDYQAFRRLVRDPHWQQEFLSQPLQTRKEQIEEIRLRSEKEKLQKSMTIMDVNQLAVNQLLKKHHYPKLLIHGHTHRPYLHHIKLDGHTISRWVLGDWYEQGSYLKCDQFGCKAMHL